MKSHERYIGTYSHNGKIGVLLEIAIATDFTIQIKEFQEFTMNVLLHIAAVAPKDLEELLAQPFVKDQTKTIAQLSSEISEYLKEEILITRFQRWEATYKFSVVDPDDRPPFVSSLKIP